MVAVIAAVIAAGLAVGGLFGPIHSLTNTFDGDQPGFAYDNTWWGVKDDSGLDPFLDTSTLGGLVLIAAAVLLVLAAVFVFLSGRSVRQGVRSAGRSLVSAGAAMLTGITVLQLTYSLDEMSRWNEDELDTGETIEFVIGIGLWLPLGGVVLAVVAVVLAHRSPRPPRREPATPPMGFRMQQYGSGPMTGQQPAVRMPGQSSGRFAPVPPPGTDPGVGQRSGQFAPVPPPGTDPGIGQGSGQFTPVPPPAAPPTPPPAEPEPTPVAHEPDTVANGPEPTETSLASRLDEGGSTSDSDDEEPDPDVTQRTTVPTEPASTPEPTPAPLDLPAAPPAPELANEENDKKPD